MAFDFSPDNRVLQIGVTGGIGTGKTYVCELFAKKGIPVFDADTRAKVIYTADLQLKKQILLEFGSDSYLPSGQFNREWMASQVFGNDSALQKLNYLVHPAVFNEYKAWVKAHYKFPYLVKEAALMFESNSHLMMHKVIAVTAPLALRLNRVLKRDPQRTKEQVLNIIDKQMPEEEKCKRADYVIQNDGIQDLEAQVNALHQKFIELAKGLQNTNIL